MGTKHVRNHCIEGCLLFLARGSAVRICECNQVRYFRHVFLEGHMISISKRKSR